MMKQKELFFDEINNEVSEIPDDYRKIECLPDELRRIFVDMVYFTFHGIQNAQKRIDSENDKDDSKKGKKQPRDPRILRIGEEHALGWDVVHLAALRKAGLLSHNKKKGNKNFQVCLSCVDDLGFMEKVLEKYFKKLIPLFRHNVTSNPLAMLDALIESTSIGSDKPPRRSSELLRSHDAEETASWAFCVPRCFNDALDISLSQNTLNSVSYAIWTQGINFAFQKNDMIYDGPQKHINWKDYLESMSTCLQIERATSAASSRKDKVEGSKQQVVVEAFPGSVTFRVLRPDSTKNKLEYVETRTVTQHEFVRILINGL